MLISDVEARLRKLVLDRIEAGELTGVELAKLTGFQQAHISNFINGRRGLSVQGMDYILSALGLRVEDLVSPQPTLEGPTRIFDQVPVIPPDVAHYPTIPGQSVSDWLQFKRNFLRRLRPKMAGRRDEWTRFITLKASGDAELAMAPRIVSGATLLIDRHYNDLEPYRRKSPNIYAVRKMGSVLIRQIEVQDDTLLLRPMTADVPLDLIRFGERGWQEHVIGRVCHVGMEA